MIHTKADRVDGAITAAWARAPDEQGTVERDGVSTAYAVFGSSEPTILLLPTWSVIHSRHWKAQVPYLARHFRVVTYDGRGNGASDRPEERSAYADREIVADGVAVLDAIGIESAFVAGLSCGGRYALHFAADHPDRVRGAVVIAPSVSQLGPRHPWREVYRFEDVLDTDEGWAKVNRHYWLRDFPGYLEFFFSEAFSEPHSTKQIEDCVEWGLDTTPETLLLTECDLGYCDRAGAEELCGRVRCPVLVLHGSDDRVTPPAWGERVAELTGGELVLLDGSGHCPQARDPVTVNLLVREFVEAHAGPAHPRIRSRAGARPRRALMVSSPIGLGHAWRDVRIVDELRQLVPGLEVEWLAQHPVTSVLDARGERIHPASGELASESGHFQLEAASGEHELPCFEALRRMDEILCANFMLFHDVVRDGRYDLWIADEAWDVDHFLHENPELKTAACAWLTDFVGYLPLPESGEREAFLTADYNAEMLERVERFPRVRDRAVFVGEPADVVPDRFGSGLPGIREWTERHFSFAGYILGFDPARLPSREALRKELGWSRDEPVCVIAVGGSGVGDHLLRRGIEAHGPARELVPGLRTVAVAGPRIDPASLPAANGVDVLPYVHELHRLFAACDVAVVQGGLTTTMELVALGRPFVPVPLTGHFEQQRHVCHRLDRYGAPAPLAYADATPEALAAAIADGIGRTPHYRAVGTDGAAQAAAMIAELV